MGRRAKSSKGKAEPKRSPVRKSPKIDAARVRDLEKRLAESLERAKDTGEILQAKDRALTEALEQQTATSEILRVISRSQVAVQPVFDTIVASAVRLCRAHIGVVYQLAGAMLHLVAHHNLTPEMLDAVRSLYPRPPQRDTVSGRAILTRAVVQIEDVLTDREFHRDLALATSWRSMVAVPMLREGEPTGAIVINRMEPGAFADNHLDLLKTFADQAVIAIENVRLFTELQTSNRDLTQALDQQTATSEILRSIAHAQTDAQPVFDAIVDSAMRLLRAESGAMYRLSGDMVHLVAFTSTSEAGDAAFRQIFPRPLAEAAFQAETVRERAACVIEDIETDRRANEQARRVFHARGYRSIVYMPMLKDGAPVGNISVARREPGTFTEDELTLLQTFADQAVIAIENVRLFNETKETLEQQTATAEILRVISGSPTDIQPVFAAIAQSAMRLCEGDFSNVVRYDGELLHLTAHAHVTAEAIEAIGQIFPMPPSRATVLGRAVLQRAVVHLPDVQADAEYAQPLAAAFRGRSALAVPMLREGHPIGSIGVGRFEARRFTDAQIALLQTFADQAVIAIENVRLFKELETRNRELTDSLTQQTATAEILRVIPSSPTDIQPVLEAITESAARLCDAIDTAIFLDDGEELRLSTHLGPIALGPIGQFTVPRVRGTLTGRAALEQRTIQLSDHQAEAADYPEGTAVARMLGVHTMLAVPLLHAGKAIGVIALRRTEIRLFTDQQIALLQTFADQAVIAIENVRLFNETKEALEQQTATAEVLRVISTSPTELQPVLDVMAESAARLCEAADASIFRVEGNRIRLVAQRGTMPHGLVGEWTLPLVRESVAGRSVIDARTVHLADVTAEAEKFPVTIPNARRVGFRSMLSVPLVRESVGIGAIQVLRREARLFSERQVALLQTFADQAVIAIENVRLFTELEEKNRALTQAHAQVSETLEQQTATSEILRTIAHAQTDAQPVFDTIVHNAARLCHATNAAVFLTDGRTLYHPANFGSASEALAAARARYPRPLDMDSVPGMVILTRSVVHVPDIEDPAAVALVREAGRLLGFRSTVALPMLRGDEAVGSLNIGRREPGRFSDAEVELLKTFADQAVIAIENVRLFKELQARTSELTQSVEKLTALGEVSRSVTSTLDVETVLETVVSRARQLAGADGCLIYEYDEGSQQFHSRATNNLDPVYAEALRGVPIRKGEGVSGRAAEVREAVQVADMTQPFAYQSSVRDMTIRAGYRAVLSVPLLREDEIIGSLILIRKTPGEFSPEIVDLLKTFATQSALAIQNARLFREIADKSAQLEAASRHKSEFLANMSHELRTPLNAIIGFSEVLNERMFGELNDKQAEYLKDIYASGQHLLSLINDILDLSKIEAGKMELEPSDFDLPSAIDNALILVRERATRRGITLGRTIDDRVGIVRGDERKVKQVLLNLLSNALKFTPEGGRIDVSAHLQDGAAEIAVADTGVGIAPEDQEAIFEEFRQVGTADKKVEGTGLGLALSRKFIELHGGRIWVKSEMGKGSTFTFTLPVRRELNDREARPH